MEIKVLKISVSTKYGSSGDGPLSGLTSFCRGTAACSGLQWAQCGEPRQLQQPRLQSCRAAVSCWVARYQWGPSPIDKLRVRAGEGGEGEAQIQGHPPGPGPPPGTGYWQNLLEATKYHFFQSIFNWARVILILKSEWFWIWVESFFVLFYPKPCIMKI